MNIKYIAATVCKYVALILVLVLIIGLASNGRVSSASVDEVAAQVLAVTDTSPMKQADDQMIRRLYGLDPADYDGIVLYCPSSNMGAEEVLIVRMADTDQQNTVKAAIEARLASQLSGFEGYGADQTAMLNDSIIEISGNYALFVSAANPAEIRQAFRDAL